MTTAARDEMPLLHVVGLTVAHGGMRAVDSVELVAHGGELIGLIGPNGAGKTTTIDAIGGFTPHHGRVRVAGVDVSNDPPHRRARAGIARTWQSVELFDDLTVRQNCEVAATPAATRALLLDAVRPRRRSGGASAIGARVEQALEDLGLSDEADRRPGELSMGRRKLVGVARALVASPRVLLLDEPAAGLDSTESAELGRELRTVVDREQLAAVLIDHDTELVFEVCDRVYVLDRGVLIASGRPEEVRVDPAVVEAYLGTSLES